MQLTTEHAYLYLVRLIVHTLMYFLDQMQTIIMSNVSVGTYLMLTIVLILGVLVTLRANAMFDTWLSNIYRFQVVHSFKSTLTMIMN